MTAIPEIYACLYVREFPAQALLRLRPELRNTPCAVIEGEPPLQQVCSLNLKARDLGICHGMTRIELETVPSVMVLTRSTVEESAAKAALLECAASFSPRVEDQSEDQAFQCMIDIAGTEKLLGPPETLAKTLLRRVKALGLVAVVAVSGSFHAAVCCARGMSGRRNLMVIPQGAESAVLAPLPLIVLKMSDEQAETFSLWGIRTLGMLAALPEKELIARMGQDGKRLRQLARGESPHLFLPVETPLTLEEHMELDVPVELLDSLLFVAGMMLEQIIFRASARALALASITIKLSLDGDVSHIRTVRPALPTNDRQLWIKLLHLDLQGHPPQAAVRSLALTAEPGRTSKVQLGLFSPQLPEPMRLDVTLARIRAIVGEDCVGSPVLKDTHQPDAFRMVPFTIASRPTSNASRPQSFVAMRQIRPAESLPVTVSKERPEAFVFREKRYTVEQAYGPWVIEGDWWNPTLWGFEQWDLVARAHDGGLLCCCLVRDLTRDCWQMAALYD